MKTIDWRRMVELHDPSYRQARYPVYEFQNRSFLEPIPDSKVVPDSPVEPNEPGPDA